MYDRNGWKESSEEQEELEDLKRDYEKTVKLCAELEDEILVLRAESKKWDDMYTDLFVRTLKLIRKLDAALLKK